MFVRRKANKSGSTSVQVVRKTKDRRQQVVKTMGCAIGEQDIVRLERQGEEYIRSQEGPCLPGVLDEDCAIDQFVGTISNTSIQVIGPELVFGTLYDRVGYNAVESEMFRHLVICRLFNPGSKLKTVDYLERYLHERHSVDSVYRFLDNLCRRRGDGNRKGQDVKTVVEDVSYRHTKAVVGGEVTVCFYDMTTLYFEAAEEDELRRCGFSKDGKHSCPQIFLGLLVAAGGNPIGYDIFEGNISECGTMVPLVERLATRFGFDHPIVVADAGLLSKGNIKALEKGGYRYILGARPKTETAEVRERVLALGMRYGDVVETTSSNGKRLILSRTEKRARKDARNREKGLARLQKRVRGGRLTKQHINNRGYNKYLRLEGEATVSIDMERYEADAAWDGIKGYVTNTSLEPGDVISSYGNLWYIERAFRLNKFDRAVRPVYHRLRNRIEGHICICFTAYTILLELERMLKAAGSGITIARAQELTKTMYALTYRSPNSSFPKKKILGMDSEQEELCRIVCGDA